MTCANDFYTQTDAEQKMDKAVALGEVADLPKSKKNVG